MSADNYYIIRRVPGGFTPVMGFASTEEDPIPLPGSPVFLTPENALDSVMNEYTEYGNSIHPECYESSVSLRALDLNARHLGMAFESRQGGTLLGIAHTFRGVELAFHGFPTPVYFSPQEVITLYWQD